MCFLSFFLCTYTVCYVPLLNSFMLPVSNSAIVRHRFSTEPPIVSFFVRMFYVFKTWPELPVCVLPGRGCFDRVPVSVSAAS